MTNGRLSIIAVQGLGAHPYYTWIGKQDLSKETRSRHRRPFDLLSGRWKNSQADRLPETAQAASEAAETMWLRDLLPNFVPHARIATYSYDSDWRRTDVKTSLRKCGEQLLNVLYQNRSDQKVSKAVLNTHPSLLRIRQERQRPLVFVGHSLGRLIIKQVNTISMLGQFFLC